MWAKAQKSWSSEIGKLVELRILEPEGIKCGDAMIILEPEGVKCGVAMRIL